MNLPNKITLSRVLLLPVFLAVGLLDFPYAKFVAAGLFIILAFSDFLDGYIARKYNMVTDFGKFLDPIADKLLCTTGLLLLIVGDNPIIPNPYGIIAIFLILLRDYAISGLRQLAQLKGVIIPADMFGKIKANFQYVMTVFGFVIGGLRAIDSVEGSTALDVFTYIFYGVVGVTVLLVILSGISYLVKGRNVFVTNKGDVVASDNQPSQNDSKSVDNASLEESSTTSSNKQSSQNTTTKKSTTKKKSTAKKTTTKSTKTTKTK